METALPSMVMRSVVVMVRTVRLIVSDLPCLSMEIWGETDGSSLTLL